MPGKRQPLTPEVIDQLHKAARKAAEQAYAPYSNFRVGAAIMLQDGTIVTGCNVENASYGLTICAERAAVLRAVSEAGPQMRIHAIAVANLNDAASPPCGACRQVLCEFAEPDTWVFFPGAAGSECLPFDDIFPFSFKL